MKIKILALSLCATGLLLARSAGPDPGYTGAPFENGGRDCTACHRTFAPANSDPAGKLTVLVDKYKPGVKQIIQVKIEHPAAQRWGFQLTARPLNNTAQMAGSFTVNANTRVRCTDGTEGPCGGNIEYAEHTQPATAAGTPNGKTFEIEWTPPQNEVGDIIVAVAANAADNTGNTANDRIYTTTVRVPVSDDVACNFTTRPTLRSVSNAASFTNNLSGNTLASIFGLGFQLPGRSRSAGIGDLTDDGRSFPKELGCVAVEVAGVRAPVYYAQNDQINFQIPTVTQLGPVAIRILLNPGKGNQLISDVGSITLTNLSPALFTFNGTSAAATRGSSYIAPTSVVPGGVSAAPGDIITFYGTGFGFTEPVWQAGEISAGTSKLRDRLVVTIGGVTVPDSDITYAGLAPGAISGLYQFNVKIPASVANGNATVTMTVGPNSTQTGVTIPVQR